MALDALTQISRARSNSGSTLKARVSNESASRRSAASLERSRDSIQLSLSIHNEVYSRENVLFAPSSLIGSNIEDGDLVEIRLMLKATDVRDFETQAKSAGEPVHENDATSDEAAEPSVPTLVCLVKTLLPDQSSKQSSFDLSISKQIAATFGFSSPSTVIVTRTDKTKWRSSHAEICFRDAYLSRSDMWRFTSQELVGKTIYTGQKLSFLNSLKATVRSIHIDGRHTSMGYFDSTTVPVFRSEAARYVIFIQMSREMWDFDSDGNGEILFNRVVNGFLPELFKRWSKMDVRHLVSIVMFGRLEYRRSDILGGQGVLSAGLAAQSPFLTDKRPIDHQDFYRVVVTDMASAQWTTILEELKGDFRAFLRDVLLFKTPEDSWEPDVREEQEDRPTRITGRLSGALQGNILEAINLAASQFSNDYIDRDLIRTGISTVVITAGSGVFDVDRELLKLTSENLTNNGIGIDVVCLSRMPLHSVPLFRYRLEEGKDANSINGVYGSLSPTSLSKTLSHASLPDMSASPAFSSTNASLNYFSRFPSAFPARLPQAYGYGIPQWIDLSYWSSEMEQEDAKRKRRRSKQQRGNFMSDDLFKPRVRMYELQMMGLTEMGMADIAIPYLSERAVENGSSLRRWNSRLSNSQYSRSLSRSPEMKRKAPATMHLPGSQHSQQGVDPTVSKVVIRMDDYDATVFTLTSATPKASRRHTKLPKKNGKRDMTDLQLKKTTSSGATVRSSAASLKSTSRVDENSETGSIVSAKAKTPRPARAPRAFSYGLKGLMPMKATAVTAQVQAENISARTSAPSTTDESSDESRPRLLSRPATLSRASKLNLNSKDDDTSRPSTANTNRSDEGSRPIKINASGGAFPGSDSLTKQLWRQRRHERNENEENGNNGQVSDSDDKASDLAATHESPPSSVPESTIPFVRNVNASNPLKRKSYARVFGRWQHLYPRKPRAATVKWRSLCTPASVPLTTEDFPSRQELENHYDALCHIVRTQVPDDHAFTSRGDMHLLFLEMISLRISHGYQFVTGPGASRALDEDLADCHAICLPNANDQSRLVVVLAMGNTIQKLELNKASSVRVTKYVEKQDLTSMSSDHPINYSPYIRTILANDYFPRHVVFRGFSEQYPWGLADNHLASQGGGDRPGNVVEQLRYWRARFVLLPVEPPASTWKKHQQEENEEEIHLLGIRALTQLWQKNRYISLKDRELIQSRMGTSSHRDENPLEVKMETLNPSQLVSLELDRLAQTEEGGASESTQLLAESEKFDRETSMTKLAQLMQSDQGIEIKHRRWHWRLHHNCFDGEQFTNWLMNNVKNMTIREDAVEFGNQLMKEGLFEHVNGRHNFKDGTYFYSIKPQYRQFRPDLTRSWFSTTKSDKSVPPTPVAEQPAKELTPFSVRTTSASNIAQQLNATSTPENKPSIEKKRKAVSLSRMIRVDVDTRKKSFLGRPEVVDVHYDRFHNPENCYHIELNWLSTTCKLVDDAIVSWTNTAEKYGLKLVEVPIAEAHDVPDAEPFRNPYRVKLALEPPKQKANNVLFNPIFYSTTSFAPHAPANPLHVDKHIYQKAILKRSNFVLDLEASNEFPEGVDIHYSWGQLEYKYTQFVHRSGVILAQIMENGDIILLANRLYNSRSANNKENRMFDPKKGSGPQSYRPAIPPTAAASMQASGIVGVNLASPSTAVASSPGLHPVPNLGALAAMSPAPRALSDTQAPRSNASPDVGRASVADVFGLKSKFAATGLWNTLITPEQIKDDLEAFCQDKARLEAFYKEVANAPAPHVGGPGSASRKATGSSSSSMLRPVKEVPGTMESDITGIPAFELPEAVTAVRELRRATVAYDSTGEMFDRSRVSSRHGSIGSGGHEEGGNGRGGNGHVGIASPLRKATK
ncbi:vacuolar membrane-associated protein iml1 [Knufia obscura]|uniref:Vacuolar membrane-associated protein IML1 n=1 Tax=Knufia obscura TaxID=1635080 RepID=A0ABR0REH3_9EURO|nr:vacuolar membrane-associated protein iml1 [Knufia obscura]